MANMPTLKRFCVNCGEGFLARRKTAIYCTTTCRVAQHRATKPKSNMKIAKPTKKEIIPDTVLCVGCNANFWRFHHNQMYCNPACRQRAYRRSMACGVRCSEVYDIRKKKEAEKILQRSIRANEKKRSKS